MNGVLRFKVYFLAVVQLPDCATNRKYYLNIVIIHCHVPVW